MVRGVSDADVFVAQGWVAFTCAGFISHPKSPPMTYRVEGVEHAPDAHKGPLRRCAHAGIDTHTHIQNMYAEWGAWAGRGKGAVWGVSAHTACARATDLG